MPHIRSKLDHSAGESRPRTMLLYGTGGVGKTQLALSYAYERRNQGLQAVFWINSETQDEVLQSCTKICVKLELQGAVKDGQHEANQKLLVDWLREIGKSTQMQRGSNVIRAEQEH